jgi:iron(III) transport system ATP-binding protein
MVFQSYAIWPHMTVYDNVAFPLQVKRRSVRPTKAEITRRVTRVLETMELGQYADRSATKLSGGQQQRLALARAIVVEPPLLLLDEPLSNLDAKLREVLRFELKRLQKDLGITSIYVTHDQVEALALSSRIAVMEGGRIAQLGQPRDIYETPQSKFVAEFIGTSNFLAGKIKAVVGTRISVATEAGDLELQSGLSLSAGDSVVVSIRPESVKLSEQSRNDTVANELTGTVLTRAFLGDSVDHIVRVADCEVRARCNPVTSVAAGTTVYLEIDPSRITLVPAD